jgi:hypothetical protein
MGLLVVVSLSCGKVTPDRAGAAIATSVSSQMPLPGESSSDAERRVFNACMDEAAQPYEILDGSINGVAVKLRGYDTKNAITAAAMESCRREAMDSFPLPDLTDADLEVSYAYLKRFVQCLRETGQDMGIVASFEEFLQSNGNITPSSRWETAATDDHFGASLTRCSHSIHPPG